jgi:hypothetical protein
MLREPRHLSDHLSDEDILLAIDGEASRSDAKQMRAHLTACRVCRSRRAELEQTIGDFISLHRQTLEQELPSSAGPLALLKARLGEAAAQPSARSWHRFLRVVPAHRAAAYLGMAVLISLLGGKLLLQHSRAHPPMVADLSWAQEAAVPNHDLTPGAIRPVSIGEVCSMAHEEVVREVPDSLRQQVFKEYGIVNPHAEDYEIDYLIAPGLGGADDIHNLWPEPSTSSAWNAHVKDALEERLHQLVCAGKLDLPTAQKAIATDWITAYKKYLSTYASDAVEQLALPWKEPA